MESLTKIRDIFWPLIDGKAQKRDLTLLKDKCQNIVIGQEDSVLEKALKCFEEEEERRKTIESKAAIFVSVITISSTLVLNYTLSILDKNSLTWFEWIQFFLMTVLILYLVRTIWFSIKTMEREKYSSLEVSDYIDASAGRQQKIKLIESIIEITERNAETTNTKVDSMTLAHLYFKRAAFILGFYAVFVFVYKFLLLLFIHLCWC
jgi:cation transport ATPase